MISNIENNINRNYPKSQYLTATDCWPISAEINEDPEYFFRHCITKTQHDLIETIMRWKLRYKMVYLRQDTLAKILGISRVHCNRLLKWMKDLGLLVSEYRFKLSCHYHLSSFFFNESIRSRLKHIFRPLRALSLNLLYGFSSFSSDVTQLRDKLNVNLTNSIVQQWTSSNVKQFNQTLHGEYPVSVAVREIKCIKLSRAGQIKLSAFPDEAILDAANAYHYAKNVKEPFNWFYKLCMEYCNRNDIKPDWPFMHSLVEYYKISLTAPMLLPAVSVRDKKSPPQKKQGTNPRSREKTSYVPPADATTEEFRKKTEWKGHVEIRRVPKDREAVRKETIANLEKRNHFVLDAMRNYRP